MTYTAPLKDMLFVMTEIAGLAEVAQLPGFEDASFETAQAVLEENAKFTQRVGWDNRSASQRTLDNTNS